MIEVLKKHAIHICGGVAILIVLGLVRTNAELQEQRDHYRVKSVSFSRCLLDNNAEFWPEEYPRPIPPSE